jgi:hypothetical protein
MIVPTNEMTYGSTHTMNTMNTMIMVNAMNTVNTMNTVDTVKTIDMMNITGKTGGVLKHRHDDQDGHYEQSDHGDHHRHCEK